MHPPPHKANKQLALSMLAIVLGMLMLAYASVPLYRLFCQATGFGGTVRVDETGGGPTQIFNRTITVSFNTDVDPALPWEFKPDQRRMSLKVGEHKLASFYAKNLSDSVTRATATYNVSPDKAGRYFHKIQCFCFSQQHLNPGQAVHWPVSFYIDPAIMEDENLKDVKDITLSYTFFSDTSANQ